MYIKMTRTEVKLMMRDCANAWDCKVETCPWEAICEVVCDKKPKDFDEHDIQQCVDGASSEE